MKARGPGELSRIGHHVSAPNDQLAYLDRRNLRVTVYSPTSGFVREVLIRESLTPASANTDAWILAGTALPTPSSPGWGRIAWVTLDSAAARVIREVHVNFEPEIIAPAPALFAGAVVTPSGRILGRVGRGRVAWFSDEGDFIALVDLPDFGPLYPTDRDVQRYITDLKTITGFEPAGDRIEAFRTRPLSPLVRGVLNQVSHYDAAGRLWLATTRNGERGSMLDILNVSGYLGSLELDDHVLSFQVRDSLLVALVETLEPENHGLYPRRIDWYRIIETQDAPG